MRTSLPIICFLPVLACQPTKPEPPEDLMARAREIHRQVITLDTHVDILVKNFTDSLNYRNDLETQVNLPKMKAGGLDVAWFIVFTPQDSLNEKGYREASKNAMDKFAAIHRLCEQYAPEEIGPAMSSADVRRIHQSGRRVAMIGVENAYPMGTDLSNFQKYHELGARYISLAHNGHSQFCDSHTGEADGKWLYNGLSELGKSAVNEMNRLGIMIDISHISKASMMQIMDFTKAPVIASHSSARALCNQSRNLDDEQLDKIKENGGVVQVVALDQFLDKEKSEKRSRYMAGLFRKVSDSLGVIWYDTAALDTLNTTAMENYMENYPKVKSLADREAAKDEEAPPAVNVSDLANHIDYMVTRMGVDHVGISSDFDGGGGIGGWSDASETFNVTLELVKRGYSKADIAKLWGGNLLRVLDEVQKLAGESGQP